AASLAKRSSIGRMPFTIICSCSQIQRAAENRFETSLAHSPTAMTLRPLIAHFQREQRDTRTGPVDRMKQVLRKGLKDIVVDETPDPVVTPHHLLVRPLYSLISSGTETASIHQDGVWK